MEENKNILLEEFDQYLILLSEMKNIPLERKIVLMEGFIQEIKSKIKK